MKGMETVCLRLVKINTTQNTLKLKAINTTVPYEGVASLPPTELVSLAEIV